MEIIFQQKNGRELVHNLIWERERGAKNAEGTNVIFSVTLLRNISSFN